MAVRSENSADELMGHLDRLHTTELGVERIRKNLSLVDTIDVVGWCRDKIKEPGSVIKRQGKNWYITDGDYRITVNSSSYTIITAHKLKNSSL